MSEIYFSRRLNKKLTFSEINHFKILKNVNLKMDNVASRNVQKNITKICQSSPVLLLCDPLPPLLPDPAPPAPPAPASFSCEWCELVSECSCCCCSEWCCCCGGAWPCCCCCCCDEWWCTRSCRQRAGSPAPPPWPPPTPMPPPPSVSMGRPTKEPGPNVSLYTRKWILGPLGHTRREEEEGSKELNTFYRDTNNNLHRFFIYFVI